MMTRSAFNLLFLMRPRRTNKNGSAPILTRITTNGQRVEISTQCVGDPTKWNQSKERCTGGDKLSQQVNACLSDFRVKVLEIRQQLHADDREGNAFEIKERFANPRGGTCYLLKEFALYCQKTTDGSRHSYSSILERNVFMKLCCQLFWSEVMFLKKCLHVGC